MKITATVNKSVDIELEVDDNSEDDIIKVCGAFDPMGDVMFEN